METLIGFLLLGLFWVVLIAVIEVAMALNVFSRYVREYEDF